MKYLSILVCCLLFLVFFTVKRANAWDDQWEIKSDGYNYGYERDIRMQEKFDYDPSDRYRGTIDDDGYTRMRDLNGNTVRGYIDDDGYGNLRDSDGSTWRVRPGY